FPRLKALFSNKKLCEELSYRAKYKMGTDRISDIFDSLELLDRHVRVEENVFCHRYFDQDSDIAIGLSTDGVCPFKNRKSTC
ncbi:hypothetical protein GGX14DRAFT_299128, partial [Mycena pura]